MHTTSCTKKPVVQPVVQLAVWNTLNAYNRLYNRLYETHWMYTTGCTTSCTTGWMKHIECIQPVVQLAEWNTLNAYNQLYNQLYNWLNETRWMHTTGCTTSCTTGCMKHVECIQPVGWTMQMSLAKQHFSRPARTFIHCITASRLHGEQYDPMNIQNNSYFKGLKINIKYHDPALRCGSHGVPHGVSYCTLSCFDNWQTSDRLYRQRSNAP